MKNCLRVKLFKIIYRIISSYGTSVSIKKIESFSIFYNMCFTNTYIYSMKLSILFINFVRSAKYHYLFSGLLI